MNPLGGVAATMGQVATAMRARRTSPLPPRPPANRAQRRREGQRSTRAITTAQLVVARRAGELARRRGLDHTKPGTCPYTTAELIGAWSEGYTGKRRATP